MPKKELVIAVKKIEVEINGITVNLSPEDVRKLRDELDRVVPGAVTAPPIWIPSIWPDRTSPWILPQTWITSTDPTQDNHTISCDNSTTWLSPPVRIDSISPG